MLQEKQQRKVEMAGLPRNLGDGLTLRAATPLEANALAEFNSQMQSDTDEPDEYIYNWTLELMRGDHPTTAAGDFTVVVDENRGGKIVSSLNLISQTWAYEGIPFGVGRPELVATSPEYRRKGLVRAQFEAVHALSAARSELIQVIGGIPWYYRQFGYEMGISMGGGRRLHWNNITKLEKGQEEVYRLRPATFEDLPTLTRLYRIHCAASMVRRLRDEAEWRYELACATEKSVSHRRFFIIEDLTGAAIGYLEGIPRPRNVLVIRELAVLPGNSLRAVAEFLTRALKTYVDELNKERKEPLQSVFFTMGQAHPIYQALGNQLEQPAPGYAWYVRVPDLPGFLRHITPVLEKRLEGSVMEGHSGPLKLNFYRSHLQLNFERGKLIEIGTFNPKELPDGDALFPDLTFLSLLFGRRSLAELRQAFPDCGVNNERSAVLLDILFPAKSSEVVAMV